MSPKKDPFVFIVVLNWNNASDTIDCLASLASIEYSNFSVAVVDNASVDDSLERIREYAKDNSAYSLDIIENSENSGFAGGNNKGIDHALQNGAEYVLVLNNDTKVEPSFLSRLVDEAEKSKSAGIVTPAIYFSDKPDKLWFGGSSKISWLRMEHLIENELAEKELPSTAKLVETDFLTGACMLIKREALKDIKGFDERYFLYFEDADISFRVKKKGWKLLWTPNAKIWHKVSATTLPQAGAPLMNYYNMRNIMLLARTHAPFLVRGFYMHLWAYYKFTKQLTKFAFSNKYDLELAKMIMQGIRDYYKGNFGKY